MADNEAIVYKKSVAAASLVSEGGRVTFSYLPQYLKSDFPSVATSLPKSESPVVLQGGATPAFFAGLLPEGRRLIAMRERVKTSLSDELGLLLDIGADLIGDVQVLVPGVDPNAPREVFQLDAKDKKLSFAQVRDEVFGVRASGLPGVQDKVSSKMLNAPVRYANYDYILKLNPVEVPLAAENEYLFLTLAKRCGIKTASFELLTDQTGERALRLRRFDREVLSSAVMRLAQEDATQLMNVYPSAKYDLEFSQVALAMLEFCSARSVAALELFKLLVFNYLIGNGDAHAKNFSLLEGPKGQWVVSPGYDLLCTRFYDDRTMALPLYGENSGWKRVLLLKLSKELDLPEPLASKVLDQQLQALAALPEEISNGVLGFPQHLRFDVASFLRKRAKSLSE